MNYLKFREWLANKEHEQWMHWSKSIAKEFHNIIKALATADDKQSALDICNDRIDKWEKNWVSYQELPEQIKDHDREWAEKIMDRFPIKCPIHQCGGYMKMVERKLPNDFIESEHYDGDEQTPDLICYNCGGIYQFKGFRNKLNHCSKCGKFEMNCECEDRQRDQHHRLESTQRGSQPH